MPLHAELDQAVLLGAGVGAVGEDDGAHARLLNQRGDVVQRAEREHRLVGDGQALLLFAIGEKAHDAVVGRVLQTSEQRGGLVAGAIDQHAVGGAPFLRVGAQVVVENLHRHAYAEQEEQRHEEVGQHTRNHLRRAQAAQANRINSQQQFLPQYRPHKTGHTAQLHVADNALVRLAQPEEHRRDQQRGKRVVQDIEARQHLMRHQRPHRHDGDPRRQRRHHDIDSQNHPATDVLAPQNFFKELLH